jgi:hypothetical protein
MPQPPAYAPAEIILAGQKLETATGVVTQASLHAALGGRGMPSTAWRVWSEYVELRGPWKPPAPCADPERSQLSAKASQAFSTALAAVLAFGELMRDETAETHALRGAQALRAQDDLLAASARLSRELEQKCAENAELREALDRERQGAERASQPFALAACGPASSWAPRSLHALVAAQTRSGLAHVSTARGPGTESTTAL